MFRFTALAFGWSVACGLVLSGPAAADMIGPKKGFPPNKGGFPTIPNIPNVPSQPQFLLIPVDHVFTTDKEYPDYSFFKVVNDGALEVEFTPKVPIQFRAAKLPAQVSRLEIVAIPRDAKSKYKTEKELLAAVVNRKIPGRVATKGTYPQSTIVQFGDPRPSVLVEHAVDNIDPKKGWVILEAGKKKCGPDEDEEAETPDVGAVAPAADVPAGRGWVAGLALFAGLVTGGLWLARREPPTAKA